MRHGLIDHRSERCRPEQAPPVGGGSRAGTEALRRAIHRNGRAWVSAVRVAVDRRHLRAVEIWSRSAATQQIQQHGAVHTPTTMRSIWR